MASDKADRETIVSEKISESDLSKTLDVFDYEEIIAGLPPIWQEKDFYSRLVRGILQVRRVQRGQLTCFVSVKPAVVNYYGGLHGGAVAAISEVVTIACARTVVAEDKELFLGELGMSYLSAAPANAELIVNASVMRSGRNVTVVGVEFKMRETGKLVYTARATFYTMPTAKL